MKLTTKIAISIITASLLATGVAAAGDYTIFQISTPNGGPVTALRPTEEAVSVALYPGTHARRSYPTARTENDRRVVQMHASSNAGHVSYSAPAK